MKAIITRALMFYGYKTPNHFGKWRLHSLLRKMLGVKIDKEALSVRNGLQWSLNPSDYVQSELFWLGLKDRWNIHHIRKVIKYGDIVFDIGANFGYYAISIASYLQRKCKVYAFEPNPTTYAHLVKNIRLNSLESAIEAIIAGLSNVKTVVYINEPKGNTGAANIIENGGGAQVHLYTLDEFCLNSDIHKVDFIKIDVEGYEGRVLKGGQETIRVFKPVILIELNPVTLTRINSSVFAIVEYLKENAYQLYEARRGRLMPLVRLPDKEDHLDVFCFPVEKISYFKKEGIL